jgi:ketosteroid isomerase-like protein
MRPSTVNIAAIWIFTLVANALSPVSGIYAASSAAVTQSVQLESTEKAEVERAISEYTDAFIRGDISAIGQHINAPFNSISSRGVEVIPTTPEIEAWYGDRLQDLKRRGYSYSKRSETHVKMLAHNIALVSAIFVRYRADGSELETGGNTYLLHKTEAEWKIVVNTSHPPANVVKAE